MRRRNFLKATVATAGVLFVGTGCAREERTYAEGHEFFPQSLASGDPKPSSVVLWTRVHDEDADDDETLTVFLEVARDAEFEDRIELDGGETLELSARARFDHCIKVRVEALDPATTYFYRFVYFKDGVGYRSRTGRTKTAPAADDDTGVRFAFISCQDYIGKYYNPHALLAEQELDFFVHLGDYVYETTGDAAFQDTGSERSIEFDHTDGALLIGEGEHAFYAARSLDNYRQLYRTYRSDRALQRLHERFAMVAIWDDHEFSDDCHGATGTYLDGREDETDIDRRKHANRAWFEYMPVDYADDPEFEYDDEVEFPGDIRIHRELGFGRHLHLVLTDLRTYRSDHLIPEDAYPGTVVMDQATLMTRLGALPDDARPYVDDIATYQGGIYLASLVADADAAAYDASRITGPISAGFINTVVERVGDGTPLIDESTLATLPRGYAYTDLTKNSFWGQIGARYLVSKNPFDVYSAWRFEQSEGASEQIMGDAQQTWFLDTMRDSDATWKVWGNEFCLSPLQIDLSSLNLPEAFRKPFYINVDHWDGARNRRNALITALAEVDNVVAITGDIHAFYASTPMVNAAQTPKLVEFVTSSMTSNTYQTILERQVAADETLSNTPGASSLAAAIRDLMQIPGVNPHLAYAATKQHGFAIADVTAEAFEVTFYVTEEASVLERQYGDNDDGPPQALVDAFDTVRFRTLAGERELYMDDDGNWLRWDPATNAWV